MARKRPSPSKDAWPLIPGWVPGVRGPIEIVRPPVVRKAFEEEASKGRPGKTVLDLVSAKYQYSDRRILVGATIRRPAAWLALETSRYVARLEDFGLHNLIEPRVVDTLTEALARQHIRSWRREGAPLPLPRYGNNESYPPLPTLVYEYGTWIRVDRPMGSRSDSDGIYGEAHHETERLWVMRNLPRAQAWHVFWHERYEARLHESAVGKLLDEDLKETVCDDLATARILEAQMLYDWQTPQATAPRTPRPPEPPARPTSRRRRA